ncbi:MAG: cation diffusion facilitator family transporter [bacterium]|nr:cation diffusion facilitator family transporter [bacterium]
MHDERHSHGHKTEKLSAARFSTVIFLNIFITLSEIIGGTFSGSLSLISDALHNFSDSVSLMITFFSMRISQRKRDSRKTFGYKRAEIIAALVNGAILAGVSLFLYSEALKRFMNPKSIESGVMLTVAAFGFLGNIISVLILMKSSSQSLNIKSSYTHLLSDALSSVAVIIGGLAIRFFSLFWIDPLLSVLIASYVLVSSWRIIRDSVNILMQSAPEGIDVIMIKNDIEKLSGVSNIHHVHVWLLDDSTVHFECHVNICEDLNQSSSDKIRKDIEEILSRTYGISHTTMQFEYNTCKNHSLVGE